MKYIFVLFLLSLSFAYSQDTEPTSWEFIWGHSSTPRPFDVDSFQQKSVMVGFQWGGSYDTVYDLTKKTINLITQLLVI